jgi:hypothetical protein
MRSALTIFVALAICAPAAAASFGLNNTEWQTINSNGQVIVEGKIRNGLAEHHISFSCEKMAGTWKPSQWGGYKELQMDASFGGPGQPGLVPTLPAIPRTNYDRRVSIETGGVWVPLAPDDFMSSDPRVSKDPKRIDVGFEFAHILVSSWILDVLRSGPTLHIRFGDPNSDDFGIASDLAAGRQMIMDFAERCK